MNIYFSGNLNVPSPGCYIEDFSWVPQRKLKYRKPNEVVIDGQKDKAGLRGPVQSV